MLKETTKGINRGSWWVWSQTGVLSVELYIYCLLQFLGKHTSGEQDWGLAVEIEIETFEISVLILRLLFRLLVS